MAKKMLVDLQRCIGCWTCSMACKVGNGLDDEDYRITVRTNGSGAGIDRPQGIYPNLRMSWQPIYQKSCTFCAENVAEGNGQYCVMDCPTGFFNTERFIIRFTRYRDNDALIFPIAIF